MAFEPPPRTTQLRAIDLTNAGTPHLLKGLDDDDSDWNLVETKPIGTLTPNLGAAGSHLEVVTVTFDDGSVRWFEPHEPVLIGPVTNRIGGDRQQIREVADGHGWIANLMSTGMYSLEICSPSRCPTKVTPPTPRSTSARDDRLLPSPLRVQAQNPRLSIG
jgi:hypothetical protein